MINWEEIKQEYETTKITLAKLAEEHDITLGTIKSQRSHDTKNGNPWVRDGTDKVATNKEVAKPKKKIVESDEPVAVEVDGLTEGQRLFGYYFAQSMTANGTSNSITPSKLGTYVLFLCKTTLYIIVLVAQFQLERYVKRQCQKLLHIVQCYISFSTDLFSLKSTCNLFVSSEDITLKQFSN